MSATVANVAFCAGDGDNVGVVDMSGFGDIDDGFIEDMPDDDVIGDPKRSLPLVSDIPKSSVD